MRNNQNCNSSSQHAASSLCDEIVTLWRLAALNPALSPIQRDDLSTQLKDWHMLSIDKVRKARGSNVNANGNTAIKKSDIEIFPGFKPALEACQLDWCDYVILGVTYVEKHPPHWRFSFGRVTQDSDRRYGRAKMHHTSQVSGVAMKTPADSMFSHGHGLAAYIKSQEYRLSAVVAAAQQQQQHNQAAVAAAAAAAAAEAHADGAYSSSSEGFCDSERRESGHGPAGHDSDSDLGAELDGIRPNKVLGGGLLGDGIGGDEVFSAAGEAGSRRAIPAAKISKAAEDEDLDLPMAGELVMHCNPFSAD